MQAQQILTVNFDLGEIRDLRVLPGGSADCYLVATASQSYVLKPAGRADFMPVIDRAAEVLNNKGYLQAEVIRAKDGGLITHDGYTLFQFIPGEVPSALSAQQAESLIRYLQGFNLALSEVPISPEELANSSVWDKAKSLRFLCQEFQSSGCLQTLAPADESLLCRAIGLLCEHFTYLESLPRQLVHSDLGPGNIVFQGEKVQAIIDFTPDYEHELYSLAQFLYWTRFYPNVDASLSSIQSAMLVYYQQDTAAAAGNLNLLLLYLLKAGLFRVVGPLLQMQESGAINPQRLSKRLAALRSMLKLLQPE